MADILDEACAYVDQICQQYQVDDSHGLMHALAVKSHLEHTLKENQFFHLDQEIQNDLILAALLHDLDDHKYFPSDAHNAQKFIASRLPDERVQRILTWINYVSTSKNGNKVPLEAIEHPWVLWPRYCDRIEAVGQIGLQRLIDYSRRHQVKDYVETTPKAKNYDEVMTYVIPLRFENYLHNNGHSASIIDHIYDKLLHICDVETYSPYINHCLSNGKQLLIDVCINYGRDGKLNES